MKNIHILLTDKPSRLFDDGIELYLGELKDRKGHPVTSYNIYITSNEEIKEGEYQLYNPLGNFDNAKVSKAERLLQNDGRRKKIILTTDQDLIKDGVQAIDDEFLEWFVKNPSCEYVKVTEHLDAGFSYGYKIIIPKEEPKQETLEEVAKKYSENWEETTGLDYENTVPSEVNKLDFINGAKWQSERMYSEEDIIDLIQFLSMNKEFNEYSSVSKETARYFLEQFKKK